MKDEHDARVYQQDCNNNQQVVVILRYVKLCYVISYYQPAELLILPIESCQSVCVSACVLTRARKHFPTARSPPDIRPLPGKSTRTFPLPGQFPRTFALELSPTSICVDWESQRIGCMHCIHCISVRGTRFLQHLREQTAMLFSV